MERAFEVNPKHVNGERVLLFDDLYRSGATMNAMPSALLQLRIAGIRIRLNTDQEQSVKTVFVGGSRKISRIGADVKQRIDRMIEGELLVLVGDANGADKAIQTYLHERAYGNVQVFCTGGDCRNNVGRWPIQRVTPPHRARDFAFFTAKDAVMAEAADAALMLWDGESNGTLVNVARMTARGKPAFIYVAPLKSFETIRSRADLERLLAGCSVEDRVRINEYIAAHAHEYAQAGMF